MALGRKAILRKSFSLIVCVSMALVLIPLAGKAADKGRVTSFDAGKTACRWASPLSSLIDVNNPFPFAEFVPVPTASTQDEEKNDKTDKTKVKDERLKDHGNSTSKKPPNGGD